MLVMLHMESYNTVPKATSHGRLTMVDLARSERILHSEASDNQIVKAATKKFLSTLVEIQSQCCA